MSELQAKIRRAADGATGRAVILSPNPIHDTGGGQRSAQLAQELLGRGFAVLFVGHDEVTETVDLGLRYDQPRLVETALGEATSPPGRAALEEHLTGGCVVLTQVPVRPWLWTHRAARAADCATVYDCVDRWDTELGRGWYRRRVERRIACSSDVLLASAPELVRHVSALTGREPRLVPNAHNATLFPGPPDPERPSDLPAGGRVAIYVGALWGGWLDWELVRRLAGALPGTRFVFIGDHRGEGGELPSNCSFLGLKAQTSLPAYLAHAEVAFIPWRVDAVTAATSPLKVYEFVASGLPVVAPPIETLRGVPGVELVSGPDAFERALGHLGRTGLSAQTTLEMERFAAENGWVQRVDAILAEVAAARRAGSSG